MIPLIQYGLTCKSDGVYLRYQDTDKGKEKQLKIKSVEHLDQFLFERAKKAGCYVEDFIVMCSSSMDFPEESTGSKKVITLAHAVRNPLPRNWGYEVKDMYSGKAVLVKDVEELDKRVSQLIREGAAPANIHIKVLRLDKPAKAEVEVLAVGCRKNQARLLNNG